MLAAEKDRVIMALWKLFSSWKNVDLIISLTRFDKMWDGSENWHRKIYFFIIYIYIIINDRGRAYIDSKMNKMKLYFFAF